MNNIDTSNLKRLFPDAARLLESRLYPEPPSRDELRSLYPLSDEYNKNILSMSQTIIAKRSRTKTLKTVFLAAAIIITLIVFALCIGAAEGLLFSMKTVDVNKTDGSLDYTVVKNEKDVIYSSDHEQIIFPSYIPEGFERDTTFRSPANEQRYVCGDRFYYFSQSSLCSTTVFNTEKYKLQHVQIGDNIAYYIEVPEQDYIHIAMECQFGHLSVQGNISLEDCIKILESTINM